MKNLSIAFLAAVSLVSFAGCKKGNNAMAKAAEFKDEMCKCTDKACADKVNEAYMKWGAEQKGDGKEAKMSEEDMKKATEIGTAYAACMTKLMTPAMTPPPAGDKPAAPAGDKPADPAAAPAAPAGDKPADPAAAPAGDKPADKPAGAN